MIHHANAACKPLISIHSRSSSWPVPGCIKYYLKRLAKATYVVERHAVTLKWRKNHSLDAPKYAPKLLLYDGQHDRLSSV